MGKMLLKTLVIQTTMMATACATMLNSGGDKEITVTSDSIQTKFYHNGKFIGRGYSATTYASGSGSDVLTGLRKGCAPFTANVRKGVSTPFMVGNFVLFALFIILPPIAGLPVGLYYFSDAAFYAFLGIDAASGSWRSVNHTKYDLTPECE